MLDLLSKGLYALCQSGLEKSVMNMLWESAMLETVGPGSYCYTCHP